MPKMPRCVVLLALVLGFALVPAVLLFHLPGGGGSSVGGLDGDVRIRFVARRRHIGQPFTQGLLLVTEDSFYGHRAEVGVSRVNMCV
jgi:hypothetical protein